jgi:phosphatidylglycerol---prolipoprotein diacylglyceryl transferase
MLPYIPTPSLAWTGLNIEFFGLMVIAAVGFGFYVFRYRAVGKNLGPTQSVNALLIVVASAFLMSHLFSVVLYNLDEFLTNPGLIFSTQSGMSNMGGIVGGLIGILIAKLVYGWARKDWLQFADCVAWGFVFGHLFGRFGCALAHDHLGVYSNSFFAVNFPDGPRFDLGLIEWFWIIAISVLLFKNRSRTFQPGVTTAGVILAITVFRFFADFLRAFDQTYLGLTPAQLFAIPLALAATLFIVFNRQRK